MWIKITVAFAEYKEGEILYGVDNLKDAQPTEHYKVCVKPFAEKLVKKGWAEECSAPDIRKKEKKVD